MPGRLNQPRIALLLATLLLATISFAQTVTDLHDFNGVDGGFPYPPIVGPDGSIYVTTQSGGNTQCGGCGTVVRLTSSNGTWTPSTLYQFEDRQDGRGSGTLALDKSGNLYGITFEGSQNGSVYRLIPGATGQPWHFQLLYEFTNGEYALSPLFVDTSGAIYGISLFGDANGCNGSCGLVFQLVPPSGQNTTWTENVLYEFQGEADGGNPRTLLMDKTGVIYGTNSYGGANSTGVIFRLTPRNGTWNYSVLYPFGPSHQVLAGPLAEDAAGNLYSILSHTGGIGGNGGDVFQLSPPANGVTGWTPTFVHHFAGSYDATYLAVAPNGTVYGCIFGDEDFNPGYLFQVTPPASQGDTWTYKTLVNFNRAPYLNYQSPTGVVVGLNNTLFATLGRGGSGGSGAILQIVP